MLAMFDPALFRHFVVFVLSVATWELLKALVRSLVKEWAAKAPAPDNHAQDEDYKQLKVPKEPHIEFAFVPPNGLHHSNARAVSEFETDHASGKIMLVHAPTGPETAAGPDGLNCGDYFHGKSRLWEIRFQVRFMQTNPEQREYYFGIELGEHVEMNVATKQAQKLVVAAVKQVVWGVYQSPGDDPRSTAGECELPHCVFPLWAIDQFIETPEGQEPPALSDPQFPTLGKKRCQRVAEYRQEIDELQRRFRAGPTYSFAMWGPSRFLDVMNSMVVGIPIATPIPFAKFAGTRPPKAVFYSLPANHEGRHLGSCVQYYVHCPVFSSFKRPQLAELQELTGLSFDVDPETQMKKSKSFRRRFKRSVSHILRNMAACSERIAE